MERQDDNAVAQTLVKLEKQLKEAQRKQSRPRRNEVETQLIGARRDVDQRQHKLAELKQARHNKESNAKRITELEAQLLHAQEELAREVTLKVKTELKQLQRYAAIYQERDELRHTF